MILVSKASGPTKPEQRTKGRSYATHDTAWGKRESPELAPRPEHIDSADLPTFQAAAKTGLECSMSPPSPKVTELWVCGKKFVDL